MELLLEVIQQIEENWPYMAGTCALVAFSIFLAGDLGLNRPWPLAIILAGVQTLVIAEGFAFVFNELGMAGYLGTWVSMSLLDLYIPQLEQWARNGHTTQPNTIWDHFEEMEIHQAHGVTTNGGQPS